METIIYFLICHLGAAFGIKAYDWWHDEDSEGAFWWVLILGLPVVALFVGVLCGCAWIEEGCNRAGKALNDWKARIKVRLYGEVINYSWHEEVKYMQMIRDVSFDQSNIDELVKERQPKPQSAQPQFTSADSYAYYMRALRASESKMTIVLRLLDWMADNDAMPVYRHKAWRKQPLAKDAELFRVVRSYKTFKAIHDDEITALRELVRQKEGVIMDIKAEPLPELDINFVG